MGSIAPVVGYGEVSWKRQVGWFSVSDRKLFVTRIHMRRACSENKRLKTSLVPRPFPVTPTNNEKREGRVWERD